MIAHQMKTVLVTGATGYVGGRLVPRLLSPARVVRVLVRDPGRVLGRPWADGVEVVRGDISTGEGLAEALFGVETAYYLVHSMGGGAGFEKRDREAALRFGAAARAAGVRRLIYLGGLLPPDAASEHLLSRAEVGRLLAEAVPTTEFRAGPVVGSGSASFEMVRYLTERLPLMIAPSWIDHKVQPIAIRDVLFYLTMALDLPPLGVADTRRALELFPDVKPIDYRMAVHLALGKVERGEVETRWSGALGHGPTAELEDSEGLARETRSCLVRACPEAVFRSFSGVGGDRGWPAWEWAWILRGVLDRLVGGPGLRRGRRHPDQIFPGEALDFWRVEAAKPPHLLRLRAEMRLPGRAWLQWETIPEEGGTRLVQTALFAPSGLLGAAYWYGLYPFHQFIFSAMVEALARRAESGK